MRRRRHTWYMIPIGYGRAETRLTTPAAEPIPQQALLWGGFRCRSEGATQGSLHQLVLACPCFSLVFRVVTLGPINPLFTLELTF